MIPRVSMTRLKCDKTDYRSFLSFFFFFLRISRISWYQDIKNRRQEWHLYESGFASRKLRGTAKRLRLTSVCGYETGKRLLRSMHDPQKRPRWKQLIGRDLSSPGTKNYCPRTIACSRKYRSLSQFEVWPRRHQASICYENRKSTRSLFLTIVSFRDR